MENQQRQLDYTDKTLGFRTIYHFCVFLVFFCYLGCVESINMKHNIHEEFGRSWNLHSCIAFSAIFWASFESINAHSDKVIETILKMRVIDYKLHKLLSIFNWQFHHFKNFTLAPRIDRLTITWKNIDNKIFIKFIILVLEITKTCGMEHKCRQVKSWICAYNEQKAPLLWVSTPIKFNIRWFVKTTWRRVKTTRQFCVCVFWLLFAKYNDVDFVIAMYQWAHTRLYITNLLI